MAAYDYRCRSCEAVFEVRRGMADDGADVQCPEGHRDVARVWSAVAVTGVAGAPAGRAAAGGGGCCGGACGCGG